MYNKKTDKKSWAILALPAGISLGIIVGMIFGSIAGNISIGICFGVMGGAAIGILAFSLLHFTLNKKEE